mmetsp:Transcript_49969/g.109197  ORF Transcript_49969/g.109197 Transcript_49969/m.109197 type:complete len:274 (-) Transcript_49969:779-1600(-)
MPRKRQQDPHEEKYVCKRPGKSVPYGTLRSNKFHEIIHSGPSRTMWARKTPPSLTKWGPDTQFVKIHFLGISEYHLARRVHCFPLGLYSSSEEQETELAQQLGIDRPHFVIVRRRLVLALRGFLLPDFQEGVVLAQDHLPIWEIVVVRGGVQFVLDLLLPGIQVLLSGHLTHLHRESSGVHHITPTEKLLVVMRRRQVLLHPHRLLRQQDLPGLLRHGGVTSIRHRHAAHRDGRHRVALAGLLVGGQERRGGDRELATGRRDLANLMQATVLE